MIEDISKKPAAFWQARKKLLKTEDNLDNHLQTEDGSPIKDPKQRKNHYEDLYQARQSNPTYHEHNTNLINRVNELRKTTQHENTEPFSKNELNTIIKKLKPRKATGPDKIPNSIFIKADQELRNIYLNTLNKITTMKAPPTQWQEREIIRLYKGKGIRGKCSNERGMTLSSNMGKVYERLLNRRILDKLEVTEEQAGGRKGVSTTDHILRLKEAMYNNKKRKKNTCITFLDVTKTYDKA